MRVLACTILTIATAFVAQCAATASGRAAQCLNNPYFAQGDRKLPRYRGVY